MPRPRFLHPIWLSLLLTAFLVLGGCDNTIEPFSEKGAYSIYGFLSLSRTQQFVRVKPLAVPITKIDSHSVDATVTLENLAAGTSEVLRDSIIAYKDAESTILTHNFWTDAPITPETKYRVSVEGPQGKSVQATTTTPTNTDAGVSPQKGGCRNAFTIVFKEVSDLRNVRTWVEIKLEEHPQKEAWVSLRQRNMFTRGPGDVAMTFTPLSLLISLDERIEEFSLQRPELPDSLNPFCWRSNFCAMLDSDQIRIRYLYLGPDWYGSVPEDSLTYDPLTSNDVQNGLGFFGSVRRDRDSTTVDTTRFIWTGGRRCNQPPPDSI